MKPVMGQAFSTPNSPLTIKFGFRKITLFFYLLLLLYVYYVGQLPVKKETAAMVITLK